MIRRTYFIYSILIYLFCFNYHIFSKSKRKKTKSSTSTQQQLRNFVNPIWWFAILFLLFLIYGIFYIMLFLYIGICFLFIFSKTILYRPRPYISVCIQPRPVCAIVCRCYIYIYIWFDNFILLCYCYNIYRLYILMMIFSIFSITIINRRRAILRRAYSSRCVCRYIIIIYIV